MTKREFPDEEIEVTLPVEQRLEDRVPRGHSLSEWKFKQEYYGYRCAYCGIHKRDTPEGYLTRDHIIPITEGGDDNIDNIVPACKSCNWKKGPELPGHMVSYPRVRKRKTPKR